MWWVLLSGFIIKFPHEGWAVWRPAPERGRSVLGGWAVSQPRLWRTTWLQPRDLLYPARLSCEFGTYHVRQCRTH